MTDTKPLYQLYRSYHRLPHGKARADAIRSAIADADLQKDHFWRFHMRDDLMLELAFHGDEGMILPIITEMIAIYEAHPIQDATNDYVYAIYLCINQWACHPKLPQDQLDTMMARYKKAVDQYRLGDKSYYERYCEIAIQQQNWNLAEQSFHKMLHPKFPDTSGCAACTCYFKAYYFLETRQKEKAVEAAQPLLNGQYTCEQHPQGLFSDFLLFALDYETAEEASYWAHLLERELKSSEYDCAMLRWHAYNDLPRALRMLESGVSEIWGQWDQSAVFDLCAAAWTVCLQYSKQFTEPAALMLPQAFPLWQENGLYHMDTLGTFFHQEAEKIAHAFDARNCSHYYQTKLNNANHLGTTEIP